MLVSACVCACVCFHKRFLFLRQYLYIHWFGMRSQITNIDHIFFLLNLFKIAITNDLGGIFNNRLLRIEQQPQQIEDERNEWLKTKVNELLMQNWWKLDEMRWDEKSSHKHIWLLFIVEIKSTDYKKVDKNHSDL